MSQGGRYTIDGDWIPEGYEYNCDGDLKYIGVNKLAPVNISHTFGNITINTPDGGSIGLGEAIADLYQQVENIHAFLEYKGITVDNNEFAEFVEARKLVQRMAKKIE